MPEARPHPWPLTLEKPRSSSARSARTAVSRRSRPTCYSIYSITVPLAAPGPWRAPAADWGQDPAVECTIPLNFFQVLYISTHSSPPRPLPPRALRARAPRRGHSALLTGCAAPTPPPHQSSSPLATPHRRTSTRVWVVRTRKRTTECRLCAHPHPHHACMRMRPSLIKTAAPTSAQTPYAPALSRKRHTRKQPPKGRTSTPPPSSPLSSVAAPTAGALPLRRYPRRRAARRSR